MPKVSVIVPIYGVEKYIERCVRSLMEQTLEDIEYIFVNDCTPDKSIDILEQVIADYPLRKKQCKISNMQTNSGQAAVRLHGTQLLTGDYTIHCDSDDWVEPTAYEKMWNKAVSGDYDIVVCDYYISDGVTKQSIPGVEDELYNDKKIYFSKLLRGDVSTAIWNKLVRSKLYTQYVVFQPTQNMWEDFVLNVQFTYYADKIAHIAEPLYYYFYNINSICHSDINVIQKQLKINADLILNFLNSKGIDTSNKNNDVVLYKYYARYELSIFVGNRKYRKMWIKTYPEINSVFLWKRKIPVREKLRFISLYIGFYPIILKINTLFRRILHGEK